MTNILFSPSRRTYSFGKELTLKIQLQFNFQNDIERGSHRMTLLIQRDSRKFSKKKGGGVNCAEKVKGDLKVISLKQQEKQFHTCLQKLPVVHMITAEQSWMNQ